MSTPPSASEPDDGLLAVSAVVDGFASDEERAVVAASPELQALLEEMLADRARLADLDDVEVAGDVREWSVAAALQVYDRVLEGRDAVALGDDEDTAGVPMAAAAAAAVGSSPVAPVAQVVDLQRRRRAYRLLTTAAAAVAIAFVGVAVVGGLGGGRDDEATTAVATTAAASDTAPGAMSMEAAPAAEEDPATDAAGGAQDDATRAAAETTTAGAADAPEATPFTIGPDGAAVGDVLATPDELVAWATGREAMVPLAGVEVPCVPGGAETLGTAIYDGRDAVIGRDPATGRVSAFDLATCELLAEVGP